MSNPADGAAAPPPPGLNGNHRRALASGFSHIESLLAKVAGAAAASSSPFAQYAPDLSPTQAQVVSDYVTHLRAQLAEAARTLELGCPRPRTRATNAIRTTLAFIAVAIGETSPAELRGFGALSPEARVTVERVLADLERTVTRLETYLAQGLGEDLAGRLARLERAPIDLELLRLLEGVITRRGFIDLRGIVASLTEQLEAGSFEIAVFGRVSSGKSSLLNTVLGTEALPVGVTPVTAVPSRIVHAESAGATVHFADRPEEEIPLTRVAEYVSEAGNPQNHKHVTRAVIRVPSPRLHSGVAFVDTPGTGALASAGARETYSGSCSWTPRAASGARISSCCGSSTSRESRPCSWSARPTSSARLIARGCASTCGARSRPSSGWTCRSTS